MDIIQTYNPANTSITPDELNAMKDLSDEQIAQLAKAYPNSPNGNAYLVYYNDKEEQKKQLYPLGTWANLYALRKLGIKYILPYSFKDKFYQKKAIGNAHKQAPTRTIDLSKDDLEEAEGLKNADAHIITAPAAEGSGTIVSNASVINGADVTVVDPDPKLIELNQQLEQAKTDKAHHMIIKSLEKKIEDHKISLNNTAK